jgi:hypothetical protein
VAYESIYEDFEAVRADGIRIRVVFKKAGFLAGENQPELYFFEAGDKPALVAIESGALGKWQKGNRYFTREEKIDVAGLLLKRAVESGMEGGGKELTLMMGEAELEEMAAALELRMGK